MTAPAHMSDLALESEMHHLRTLRDELTLQQQDNDCRLKALEDENERRRALRSFNGEPRISDHAVLRYAERVLGLDVDKLKKEMMSDNLKYASKGGATRYANRKARFVIRDNTVVTVLER